MVASARVAPQARPPLRVVPAMGGDDQREPTPLQRVKNTIRCQNTLCKLPLMEITRDHALIPLHARPELRLKDGVLSALLTCPGCGGHRTVTIQR